MTLVECQDKYEELGIRFDSLQDKLIAERELTDSAMTNAEHALLYLERFRGRSNDVGIALDSLRDCVANLQARFKKG